MRIRGKEQDPALSPSSPLPSASSSIPNLSPVTSPSRDSLPCKLIYVHLPFDQHSRLEVRAGQTARDAISKLLKKRNITPQLCHVNVSEDPRSEQIDLNEDLESIAARLDKNELWVHSEYLDTVSSIKHTIVRRTFIPPVNCDVCKNPIWLVGYRCEFCQFKFHQRCSSFAPLYCDLIQTVPRDEALAQRLLLLASRMEGQDAEIAESVLNQLQPNPSPAHTPEGSHGDLTLKRGGGVKRHQPPTAAKESTGPLAPYPRDRSSSAPNINAINDEVVLEHNVQVIYDSKAPIFLYKNFAKIFCKLTVCLSFEPAKWRNESMKNSATDSCLFWHSAKARKAIRTGHTTCAKYERDILLEMVDHQRFSKSKEDIFGPNDTNHFDRTDFFRKDLGNAPCELHGLDERQTCQSYPITGVIFLSHGSSHLTP
ncbi:hypothetical protein Y032_0198g1611 [Ancylostoma ceylanicum]|nr:hypothetical protein Y032_0198g1611 [Ancylostoma ceylanicum]